MKIQPKNWDSFQHYKDRSPAWIKLHRNILDDYEFHCLPDASKALAPLLWLVASEYQDGIIDASSTKLAFRLRIGEEKLEESVKCLIENGFFVEVTEASIALAELKQSARLEEKRREREEKTAAVKKTPLTITEEERAEKVERLNSLLSGVARK